MERENIAEQVANWTKEAGTMLPKSNEEISAFIENDRAVIAWNGDGSLAGFAAVTFDWPDNWKELGAVIVEPGHREHGLGHKLVSNLIYKAQEKFPEAKYFALCNEKSLKIFLDNGGQIIEDANLLPDEVFEECKNCPMKEKATKDGKLCCDTPVFVK